MSKVKRFSLEERYGYQNRKVIYDKTSDNDIELNNIYPIIGLFNQFDEQISDLQHRLEVAEKALYNLACAVEKESCVYCPIKLGGGERCNSNTCKNCKEHKARCELNCLKIIHDDSDGCIDKIVEFYIKQAESELKGE